MYWMISYEEVTDIFVRVNSLGAKLRSSDLAMAQITAKWRDALDHFNAYSARCAEAKFPVEHGTLVKNLVSQVTITLQQHRYDQGRHLQGGVEFVHSILRPGD